MNPKSPDTKYTFTTLDYVVFFFGLLVFSVVGVWTGLKGIIRQAKGRKGERGPESTIIPVSFSLLASFFSAPFSLGSPATTYLFGSDYMFIIIGTMIGITFSAHFIIGKVCRLGVTSVYEYYELRFGLVVRIVGVMFFMFNTLLILASSMYGPGLILSEVMGIPTQTSAIVIGLVGTIYITIGGLRGVVWVDVAQMLLLLLMLLALFATGIVKGGGASLVFDIAVEGSRLAVPNIDPDPTVRITVWTQIVGGAFSMASFYSTQTIAQKIISVNDLEMAKRGSVLGALMMCTYIVIVSLVGIVIYSYNVFCDPVKTGQVLNPDQLLPYFVMEVFSPAPGASGLFVAAMIGASLSNIGAGINALAALTMINFLNPLYIKTKGEDIFVKMPFIAAVLFKIVAAIWAVCVVIGGYLASVINRELMQLFLSFVGLIHGPLLGVFVLGIFFPFSNKWGALVGLLTSFSFLLWIFVGSLISGMASDAAVPLPLVTTCPNDTRSGDYNSWAAINATGYISYTSPSADTQQLSGLDYLYSISFMYYGVLSVLTTVFVGIIVSLIASIWVKQINTDPRLGYTWWFKPDEMKDEVQVEKTDTLVNGNKPSAVNPMSAIQQTEVNVVVQNFTKLSANSEDMKEKYKLKRNASLAQSTSKISSQVSFQTIEEDSVFSESELFDSPALFFEAPPSPEPHGVFYRL